MLSSNHFNSTKAYIKINFNLIPIFVLFLIIPTIGQSKIRGLETTRLKSTGGAGVGSILMDEATALNPAPIAFFNMGSIYIQKSSADITTDEATDSPSITESDTMAAIISDAKGPLKGSISILKEEEGFNKRKRYSASFASIVGKKSSMGVTYRMTEDKLSQDGEAYFEDNYKQTIFGVTHALSESFTLGFVVIDPFKVRPQDTRAILGSQYIYQDFISVMLDMGTDYNLPMEEKFLYKGAIQFKVFTDFFVRAGLFNDKGIGEKGSGAGIGWVQPRLVLDFALKNITQLEKATPDTKQDPATVKETSFSLSYKF